MDKGYLPFAAHLFFPQFLNDDDPVERALGLSFGNVFMDKCDEIWLFGEEYSRGIQAEHDRALRKATKSVCLQLTAVRSQITEKEVPMDAYENLANAIILQRLRTTEPQDGS